MSKKIISLTLAFCLVLLSVVPCFADEIVTPSAILSTKALSDTKAAGDTVDPVSSSGYRYQLFSNGVGSTPITISKWADIVTQITQSIAYSSDFLRTNISSIYGLMTSYFISNNTTGYYYWDWNPAGGVNQGAPETTETVIQAIRNIGMQTTKSLAYITEYSYQIYQNILNGLNLKVVDNTANGFSQAYFWKKWLTGSNVQLNTINANGDLNATNRFDFGSNSILGGIEAILYYYGNGLVTSASRLTQHVVDSSYATNDYLYDTDLVGTNMSKDSLWSNVRDIGSNLSLHLSRLDYVLASDEEIEARQASADNQESVVDNFIKPSGSGSASASDFADVAAAGSSVKNALDSNVSAGNAFTSLSSDSPAWGWFSQSTADSLDSTSSRTRKSADSDTPYLDRYYSDLMETLKLK